MTDRTTPADIRAGIEQCGFLKLTKLEWMTGMIISGGSFESALQDAARQHIRRDVMHANIHNALVNAARMILEECERQENESS